MTTNLAQAYEALERQHKSDSEMADMFSNFTCRLATIIATHIREGRTSEALEDLDMLAHTTGICVLMSKYQRPIL